MIFHNFFRSYQLKFQDRSAAAISLSNVLKNIIQKHERNNTLILGIPRAGVFTANIISERLSIPHLDIIIPRKLTDVTNKEQAIGAIIDNDLVFVMEDLIKNLDLSIQYVEEEISFRRKEMILKNELYKGKIDNNLLIEKINKFKKLVIVDDGIATGSTMIVSLKWIKRILYPENKFNTQIVVATPVASKSVVDELEKEFNIEVRTVFLPLQKSFVSVEQFHRKFEQISDDQVLRILKYKMADIK